MESIWNIKIFQIKNYSQRVICTSNSLKWLWKFTELVYKIIFSSIANRLLINKRSKVYDKSSNIWYIIFFRFKIQKPQKLHHLFITRTNGFRHCLKINLAEAIHMGHPICQTIYLVAGIWDTRCNAHAENELSRPYEK